MKKILLFFFSLFFFQFTSFASHVIGGNFVVDQIGPNLFRIELRVYRDCINGSPGATITPTSIRVYDAVNNSQFTTLTFSLTNPVQDTLSLGDACYTPSGICVEEYYFVDTITLPDNPNGYYFAWNICCRNQIIDNLDQPDIQGNTFYIQIPDPAIAGGNSTPDFGPYPLDGYFCVDHTKIIDLGVIDPDGDSLVYSLVDPYEDNAASKPWNTVTWLAPYSASNVCGGTPPMAIDPVTGIITVKPSALGVYVFAIRVEEYRNGVKIGETIRDIQYTALNCIVDDLPSIYLPDTIKIDVLTAGCYDVVVIDPDQGDTVSIFVTSNTFPIGATVSLPEPYQYTPDTLYYFHYTDSVTGQLDSILLPAPVFSGGSWYGTGGIGLRYCWDTHCDNLLVPGFSLNVQAYSVGCSGDTSSFVRNVPVYVIPPSGEEDIVPNVFTPNGDGVNDVFRIQGVPNPCWDTIHVEIYNRWGQLIYTSDEVEFSWDGKNSKGKEVSEGTYFVILRGTFGDEDVTRQYPVTVLREK